MVKRSELTEEEIISAVTACDGVLSAAAKKLGCSPQLLGYWQAKEDSIAEAIALAKRNQSNSDKLRIERHKVREQNRLENVIEIFNEELSSVMTKHNLSKLTVKHKQAKAKAPVGVIQWSDIHFGEQVELPNNSYNFEICSKRFMLHVREAKAIFKAKGVKNVLVACTGDMLNSDRRMDELLQNATNRSKTLFIAADIMQQAIRDLNKDFNVTVASITGNESRLSKEIGFIPAIASDNYDFTLHHLLAHIFRGSTGVTFVMDDNPSEVVISVAGQNLLLVHGHCGITSDKARSVEIIKGRYLDKGVRVDYVIWGHLHQASISDNFSRSSSMVGANDYSDKALNLTGRPSQNAYVFEWNGNRHGHKIDLQNVDGIKGYNIDSSLITYSNRPVARGCNVIEVHGL